jgi:hypothetical protein
MSTAAPKKVTLVYVASTGHIVAALTRNDSFRPTPSVADLVGDSLQLRIGPSTAPVSPPPIPVGTFLIPQADLASYDIDLELLGYNPWGQSMNISGTSSSVGSSAPVPGQPPLIPPPLGIYAIGSLPQASNASSQLTVNVASPPLVGLPYYIIVAQPLTVASFPTSAKGNLTAGSVSGLAAAATTPVNLSIPATVPNGPHMVLVLVQTMQPYVATF